MKKVLISVIVAILLIASVAGFFAYQKYFAPKPKKVHYHAGFVVYNDNKRIDFSADKYMHEKPCTLEPDPEHENDPIEIVHLHERVGDVAHIHRDNATWGRLLENLKYSVDGDVVGYSNGKKVDDILDAKIQPYESVVILIGENTDTQKFLKTAVTIERMKSVEGLSEMCGS
jgi:hypothetical protein